MQDGYIFSGSIARNIALGSEAIDPFRLKTAVELACLRDFVESLPNRLHTLVDAEGQGLSGGQKRRILLARAIYRMPDFLFLDEATSALDAKTEGAVYRGLREFAAGGPSSSSLIGSARCATPTRLSSSIAAASSKSARTASLSRRTAPSFGSSATSSSWNPALPSICNLREIFSTTPVFSA